MVNILIYNTSYCVYIVKATTDIPYNEKYKLHPELFFFKICQQSVFFYINKMSWDSIEDSFIRTPAIGHGKRKKGHTSSKNHVVFLIITRANDCPAEVKNILLN